MGDRGKIRGLFEGLFHGKYAPHIDGLRFFAIIPVVLFHMRASLCPAGYTGVDIFFVISGYLITRGIINNLSKDTFTIKDFYRKRIQRIIPAYVTMIAVVLALACALYDGERLEETGRTAIFGALFTANIYFTTFSETTFEAIAQNSLLHLWSLGVEEQFYLVIPILLSLLFKRARRYLMPLLLILWGISFAYSCESVGRSLNESFYLLPSRFWELLTGGILAFIPTIAETKRYHSMLSLLGFVLIIAPMFYLEDASPFPGVNAFPSVLGTALLIRYGTAQATKGLLTYPLLTGVGKISYSLYLWHWPVIIFWNYLAGNYEEGASGVGVWAMVAIFAISLALAFLSWRYVELPVRLKGWSFSRGLAITVSSTLLIVTVGLVLVWGGKA